ncbi:MAG: ATP phosphoribosyltransferase [Candidatus Altiarchaeota archaeon]|nr:ATP phosphoribosyltransferase [Candidatus Altiarchaeota archaeon]
MKEITENNKLRLGLPKGSLEESTFKMFEKAGFKIRKTERSYFPSIDDKEIEAVMMRAQEIPRYVSQGVLDAGLTGKDWVIETNSRVVAVADLIYSKQNMRPVKWVLAVPNDSTINSAKDLKGKRIATEVVNITKKYLARKKVKADVEFSWGATEAKPPLLADAIVEVTETGSSLKANNLRIVEVVMESNTQLIANPKAWKDAWKKNKISEISMLLQGAIRAEEKVGLKMNVKCSQLDELLSFLPALKNPTISPLSDSGWVAVETVIDEKKVREIIPLLKRKGASGIIEYPLNKIIP